MNSPTSLRWLASIPVSCLHTADALLRNRANLDASLQEAISPPAQALQRALLEEEIPVESFWYHVIALASEADSNQQLAEIALTRVIGRARALSRATPFSGLLTDLKLAYSVALPDLSDQLHAGHKSLEERWNYQGAGLLGRIANWTEPELLVQESTVAVVFPAQGGGGSAYLPSNIALIEAVPADPVPELPELVRLGWLLAQLNLDVARYSDNIRPGRLQLVAELAMLPVVLSAAEEVQLARADDGTIALAVRKWLALGDKTDAWVDTLKEWWNTYREMRPAWPAALAALDLLMLE